MESFDLKLKNAFKHLDEEINELNEKFRNSNLSLDEIQKIESEQQETLGDLKLKLKKIVRITEHLKTKIVFKACFSIDSKSFGQLDLSEYLSIDSFQNKKAKSFLIQDKKAKPFLIQNQKGLNRDSDLSDDEFDSLKLSNDECMLVVVVTKH